MNRRPLPVLVSVLFAVASVAVAASVWWPVYQTPQFVLVLVGGIGLGALVALSGWLFRLHGVLVILLAIVVYLAAGVPLTMPDRMGAGILPQPGAFLNLVEGTATDWKELVTILAPVGTYQGLLIPAFLAILGTTTVTISVALRSSRGEFAVLGPVLLLVIGIAFGREEPWFPLAIGLSLLVLLLGWLIWLRGFRHRALLRQHAVAVASVSPSHRERRRAAVVGTVSSVIILAIAASGGAVLASALPPSAERDVIRTRIEQAFNPRDYPSPLSAFRRYLRDDLVNEPLLTVTGLPQDGRVRLATLDSYDGVVYSVGTSDAASASGTFVRVPYRLEQAALGERVSMTVAISGYSGIWLPGAGQLAEIRFSGANRDALAASFFYNDVTGTGAVVGGLASGDGYRLDSVDTPTPSDAALEELRPGTAELPRFDTVPQALTDRLETWTEGVSGDGARLVAMLDGLKNDGYISHGLGADEPASRSGHGIDRIEELFTAQPMVGDAEQYAVAAALMARELGFPARVAVGFHADQGPASTVTLTGGNISAWIEVQDSSGRWWTADPVPAARDIPEEEPEDPQLVARPPAIVQPPVEDVDDEITQSPPTESEQNDDEAVNPFLATLLRIVQIVGGILLLCALIAGPFLAVIAAKLRRRALRRKRVHPADRIRGGWQEFEDSALDYGLEAPPSSTRREVAAAVGGKRAIALASVADRATFSTERPSHEDADRVWAAVEDLRRSLGAGRTRRERFRAASSLRSLRIRRR